MALFDAATQSWDTISAPFDTRYVVTGTALIGLVQSERDLTQMIQYPLPPDGS
jgi:hypothetical protein